MTFFEQKYLWTLSQSAVPSLQAETLLRSPLQFIPDVIDISSELGEATIAVFPSAGVPDVDVVIVTGDNNNIFYYNYFSVLQY